MSVGKYSQINSQHKKQQSVENHYAKLPSMTCNKNTSTVQSYDHCH